MHELISTWVDFNNAYKSLELKKALQLPFPWRNWTVCLGSTSLSNIALNFILSIFKVVGRSQMQDAQVIKFFFIFISAITDRRLKNLTSHASND